MCYSSGQGKRTLVLPRGWWVVWMAEQWVVALDHARKAHLLQGDQKHTLEANCLIAQCSVRVITGEAKQPFPLRRLLWLCCPGGSGRSKDVYNLLQWLQPALCSGCGLAPHLHSEHMPTRASSSLFAFDASWNVSSPSTEYSMRWLWNLLPVIHILHDKQQNNKWW